MIRLSTQRETKGKQAGAYVTLVNFSILVALLYCSWLLSILQHGAT